MTTETKRTQPTYGDAVKLARQMLAGVGIEDRNSELAIAAVLWHDTPGYQFRAAVERTR